MAACALAPWPSLRKHRQKDHGPGGRLPRLLKKTMDPTEGFPDSKSYIITKCTELPTDRAQLSWLTIRIIWRPESSGCDDAIFLDLVLFHGEWRVYVTIAVGPLTPGSQQTDKVLDCMVALRSRGLVVEANSKVIDIICSGPPRSQTRAWQLSKEEHEKLRLLGSRPGVPPTRCLPAPIQDELVDLLNGWLWDRAVRFDATKILPGEPASMNADNEADWEKGLLWEVVMSLSRERHPQVLRSPELIDDDANLCGC
eukprot:CAMPEP_0175947130 /NCGR_PEP_ID=MMETSP0108-20121206/27714_1 /TAXON_ID=195067 ORGANISM="Goniomonas pacifica, Strain CCMP1869" /NCGR_SAMPLE_ID=MMETSP0108 /ASSEMBLY_ACC=CAM_ASM_000204 /LENGTH=254 /DNA_ID=CAMNT_0017272725 /DNA_START=157 /DNA_END=921 /DNA_ORIENTATION=+